MFAATWRTCASVISGNIGSESEWAASFSVARVLKVRIRREEVNRYRIMNTRLDTGFFEMETEGVAMCAFDYKQVVDVIRVGGGRLNRDVSNSRGVRGTVRPVPYVARSIGPGGAILHSGRPPEGCPALH